MWDYIIGGVTLWAALFGLIMFYNGRITRKALLQNGHLTREILKRMEKNQEAMLRNQERMLKNQERAAKDHEIMISAFQKAFKSRSRKKKE